MTIEKQVSANADINAKIDKNLRERIFANKIKDFKENSEADMQFSHWRYKSKDKLFKLQNNNIQEVSRFSEPQKYFEEDLQSNEVKIHPNNHKY